MWRVFILGLFWDVTSEKFLTKFYLKLHPLSRLSSKKRTHSTRAFFSSPWTSSTYIYIYITEKKKKKKKKKKTNLFLLPHFHFLPAWNCESRCSVIASIVLRAKWHSRVSMHSEGAKEIEGLKHFPPLTRFIVRPFLPCQPFSHSVSWKQYFNTHRSARPQTFHYFYLSSLD